MSATTCSFLANRLIKADARWSAAMAHPQYRDCPFEAQDEGKPFTDAEWALYGWADAWRLMVHRLEAALFQMPEVRQGWLDSFVPEDGSVFYVAESVPIDAFDDDSTNDQEQPPDATPPLPTKPTLRRK